MAADVSPRAIGGGRVHKSRRHRLIVQVLKERRVSSQAELAVLLRDAGERVTQATLSRDLEELGAFKARLNDGRVAYRLPDEPAANGAHLRRILAEFVTEVQPSGPLVVLRTPPGGAQPVARAIDSIGVENVIGTVAGDDTVLAICREGATGRAVARHLEALIATETTGGE